MGGGGKGGGGQDWNQMAGENAYNARMGGQDYNTVMGNSVGYEAAAQAGWDQATPASPFEMPSFESSMPSYEEQRQDMADTQAELEAKNAATAEANRITQGEADRDAAYSSYMDAAGSSTDYINSEINKEQSNARLLGTDYQMNDEMKSSRINDYFASVWGEGQQTEMEQLFSEFGDPKGFEGFTVARGDGSKYASGAVEGAEDVVSTTGKAKAASPLLDEEELGGVASPLG